jgi:hypothetical protein
MPLNLPKHTNDEVTIYGIFLTLIEILKVKYLKNPHNR